MKRSDLKTLIKEEIIKVLSENTNMNFISDLTPGKYKIEYKYKDQGDMGVRDITVNVTPNDIEEDGGLSIQNFLNSKVKEGKVVSIIDIKKIG